MNSNPENEPAAFGYLQILSPDGFEYQLEIAGLGARSHAFLIDWQIRLLLAFTWLIIVGFALFSVSEMKMVISKDYSSMAAIIWFAPAACIYFLYHPVVEAMMAGRTPGKRMAGVRLVTLQGHTPGLGAILLRNVFRLIDSLPGFYFLGLMTVAFTQRHVRIGDLAAGLVLVYDETVKPKAMQQMADLAMHSNLNPEDQALLLDLLGRWKDLSAEARVRFATQFFTWIKAPMPELDPKTKPDKALKRALEALIK
jgi:uncharacterized RDD family membrane protein YckC